MKSVNLVFHEVMASSEDLCLNFHSDGWLISLIRQYTSIKLQYALNQFKD